MIITANNPKLKSWVEVLEQSDWFSYLIEYRDTLAHRIPLYIPPYLVPKSDVTRFMELRQRLDELQGDDDSPEILRIERQLMDIGNFVPVISHDVKETRFNVYFHVQLISDLRTILKISEWVREEIANA